MLPATLKWTDNGLLLLDQRRLPFAEEFVFCGSFEETAEAVRNMTVRGAPAIGAAAAFGMVLGEKAGKFEAAAAQLSAARPTAVNLIWAVERMKKAREQAVSKAEADIYKVLLEEARAIYTEDIAANRSLGAAGAELLPDDCAVITHCNAGALATAGYGTALGVFRAAREAGKKIKIYADETRPRLQGASLTQWELAKDGFDVTVITDSMAAFLMSTEKIAAVVTGADRIAANGDTANKIGTFGLAIAAAWHNIPFYIAAPLSTFDKNCPDGSAIPIEERAPDEVRKAAGHYIMAEDAKVWNPSFDVTPASLIAGIITEFGVLRAPYITNINKLFAGRNM